MSLAELLAQHPMLYFVIVPTGMGLAIFLVVFFVGCARSGLGFWAYLAKVDMEYPIKPNSRLMYHKLANVSDAHDHAQVRIEQVTEDLKVIKGKLENLAKNPQEEKFYEVQQDLVEVLNELERGSNVTPIRAFTSR